MNAGSGRRRVPVRRLARWLILGTALSASVVPAFAQATPAWPDTFESRVEALALMQTLNADLLGSSSATQTLEKWCRDHRMAAQPVIVARLVEGIDKAPTAEQLQRLRVPRRDQVKYRRVELRCGTHVLSEADNWYVPSRLTASMNVRLKGSDTPFGRVVQTLRPYRRTVDIRILWSPLPEGWEQQRQSRPPAAAGALAIPAALFEHRAVLYTRDHRPFSEVVETYQGEILAFPRSPQF
jgi:chorismate-pyruvate lyase